MIPGIHDYWLFVVTGIVWCTILALAAARVRASFARNPSAYAWLKRSGGALFIALGVRLAAGER